MNSVQTLREAESAKGPPSAAERRECKSRVTLLLRDADSCQIDHKAAEPTHGPHQPCTSSSWLGVRGTLLAVGNIHLPGGSIQLYSGTGTALFSLLNISFLNGIPCTTILYSLQLPVLCAVSIPARLMFWFSDRTSEPEVWALSEKVDPAQESAAGTGISPARAHGSAPHKFSPYCVCSAPHATSASARGARRARRVGLTGSTTRYYL